MVLTPSCVLHRAVAGQKVQIGRRRTWREPTRVDLSQANDAKQQQLKPHTEPVKGNLTQVSIPVPQQMLVSFCVSRS